MNYQKPAKYPYLALFIIFLAFFSCENWADDDDSDPPSDIVYIVGSAGDIACYWVNNVISRLPIPAGRYSEANSIAIGPNGDVYISGIYGNMACFWINGEHSDLPIPSIKDLNSSTSCIAARSNGDVYITGSYGIFTSGGSYVACYWLNGKRVNLSTPSESRFPEANSIVAADDGDVYIAGGFGDAAVNTACYWKNGTRIELPVPDKTTYAEANSIVMSKKGDVYIAGGYYDGKKAVPCYWKNDIRTDLPVAGTSASYARDIAVAPNDDVYVVSNVYIAAQNDDKRAYYWKNGERMYLPVPAGTRSSSAYDIAVTRRGDVYVAGYFVKKDGSTACYWKNNKRIDLTEGFANDILVVTR